MESMGFSNSRIIKSLNICNQKKKKMFNSNEKGLEFTKTRRDLLKE